MGKKKPRGGRVTPALICRYESWKPRYPHVKPTREEWLAAIADLEERERLGILGQPRR